MDTATENKIEYRQGMERAIARAAIIGLLEAGYQVAVDNGEERYPASSDLKTVAAHLQECDEEHLIPYKDGKSQGMVFLVYGNGGYDVICDYSCRLEPHLAGALALADKYEARCW